MRRRLLSALIGGLVGACVALTPGVAGAEGTSEQSTEGMLERDYAAGLKAIEAQNWAEAIRLLSSAALRDTRNADIENYLGFAYRNSGDLSGAFLHYNRALALNPRHRGAHEYIGEAYLMIGNLAKAEEHLAALRKICLLPCEEYGHLKRKVAEYPGAK
jgi:tetratricopeptide (TPR) repeat protein